MSGWLLFLFILLALFTLIIKMTNVYHAGKIELEDLNRLYECKQCGKFHRQYQEEIHQLIDPNYHHPATCPRCYGPSILYIGYQYEWMRTNPECPELTRRDLRKLKKALKNSKKTMIEYESIEQFLHYYKLLQYETKKKDE